MTQIVGVRASGIQRTGVHGAARMGGASAREYTVRVRFFKKGDITAPGKGRVVGGFKELRNAAAWCMGSIWNAQLDASGGFTGRLYPPVTGSQKTGRGESAKHAWPLVRATLFCMGEQVKDVERIREALHQHRLERIKRRDNSKRVVKKLDAEIARMQVEHAPSLDLGDEP